MDESLRAGLCNIVYVRLRDNAHTIKQLLSHSGLFQILVLNAVIRGSFSFLYVGFISASSKL